ncbi:Xylose isomerase domain-containing protein TIM barrel [Thermodesulfatator indicus DSM 15286]|uniref:Xylose isomerase domain-containing protein TIM barrel n=1 Tax=Thermodesulfatator indicus (strain DSM 15286 / JCM 11887 / CIR29812) TaxID=667014 RepID=F8AC36_THEID|nr:sugar phosphate isomerase/epimerase [Thermodesulfatator indicus]AEH44591.1 Xylose isomerase domain-containing protein TIM barrel [Thermodesulfatator indicus DSM 15286]
MISEKIKKEVHLALPVVLFEKYLPLALEQGLSLEVGLDDGALDLFSFEDFEAAARILKEHQVKCSVHSPFRDLSLGALDSAIKNATVKRLKEALKVAALFGPEVVVLHTGYSPAYHLERREKWQEAVRESFISLAGEAENLKLKLAVENVLEPDPSWLTDVVEKIASPNLGYCFDAGHALAFAKSSWEPWVEAFGQRLFELHVHDNDGTWDDHLPPGQGKIPFKNMFAQLAKKGIKPLVTYEAHRPEDVIPGLAYLEKLFSEIGW